MVLGILNFLTPPLKHCFKGYPIPASPTEERFVTADGQADADGPRQRLGRKREGHQVGEGRRLVPNESKKSPAAAAGWAELQMIKNWIMECAA